MAKVLLGLGAALGWGLRSAAREACERQPRRSLLIYRAGVGAAWVGAGTAAGTGRHARAQKRRSQAAAPRYLVRIMLAARPLLLRWKSLRVSPDTQNSSTPTLSEPVVMMDTLLP